MALSTDSGSTFGPIGFDSALISPVCQASIVAVGSSIYFSNPATRHGRSHTTIKRSGDGGKSWPSSLLIEPGPSAGYSCLIAGELKVGSTGQGGVLYEAPGETIKFARFALEF